MSQTGEMSVDHPVLKVVSVWAMLGITSWADLAAVLAAMYSLCLLAEWLWKHGVRTFLERRGWIKWRPRRKTDRENRS